MKKIILLLILISELSAKAQTTDHVYKSNVKSVKLFKYGDIYSYPVMTLNSNDQLELHFDDMDADIKNYYYTYELCDANWSPSELQPYDYIQGFQSTKIDNYRNSSIIPTRYTNYQAIIPDASSVPTRSGNYILKVFLDNDTSNLVFTKRFLIIDKKVLVTAQVLQPFNSDLFRTHQRVQVDVSTTSSFTVLSPQDFKVVIIQNNIWSTALLNDRPSVFRGNYYEYNDELTTTFEGGKEWRWIDLRSLRLKSDRTIRMIDSSNQVHVFVKPDMSRAEQAYIYYADLDGIFTIENIDYINPYWESDYAYVHFTYIPPRRQPYEGKNLYLFGELTNYATDDSSLMIFDPDKGVYEKTLYLKQGFYNYDYVTVSDNKQDNDKISFADTEGNYFGTENSYTILVYFRSFGGRSDELIGYTKINSVTPQQ